MPPLNIEAEQSLLGAILIQNERLPEALSIITTPDFYREAHRTIFDAMLALARDGQPIDAITLDAELRRMNRLEDCGGARYMAELAVACPAPSNIRAYAQIVRNMSIKRHIASVATSLASHAYGGVSTNALIGEANRLLSPILTDTPAAVPDVVTIDWEDHGLAVVANEEYLTHRAVVEGLCYAKTASLLVGGKHSGKTTNARTIAMSVCRGYPVFGRGTVPGPVLYCASEDEVLVVRNQLLRMGWNPEDQLNLMKIGSKTVSDPERLLDAIAVYAKQKQAVLIVLDMLFDFAGIKDEMSYAGTREAAGKVYDLAMRTDAHVIATHHSPKYLSSGATAETAALGSQGVAARFSPIILSRHWGGDLYTIESTPPRDPRGRGLDAVCVTLDETGMSIAGEKFVDSMRWRVMAPKVLDFIQSVDPGQQHSVAALAEGMEINRPMMQTILYNLCREGKLYREKKGRSYKYFLPQQQTAMWNQPED